MSYVVYVFQAAEGYHPDSVEEVMEEVDRQREMSSNGNPLFVQLATRLMEDFPEEDEGVWVDGVLDGEPEGAVYNIGITSDYVDAVRLALLKHARDLGLTVLDEQAGEACMPDWRTVLAPRR